MKRHLIFCGLAMSALSTLAQAKLDAVAPAVVSVVQNTPGYNSWPMIQAIGDKLVCAYSRGSAHTIGEGKRGVFARTSLDCGKSWREEVVVTNDPAFGEVTIGKGLDSSGAMLLWVRNCGKVMRHDLYRTVDGVSFEKISSPKLSPMPMQITDVFTVPNVGLMALWFAGDYKPGPHNSWGMLTSVDDGHTWVQRTIEDKLEKFDWPTEPSGVYIGEGRILVLARSEGAGCQFQITSTDFGKTWKRSKTNIKDVRESTPSLLFDRKTGTLANYYYHRGARQLKRRVVQISFIFDRPNEWPAPEILATGHEQRAWDAGNVNATTLNNTHHLATYTGTEHDTIVAIASVPAP